MRQRRQTDSAWTVAVVFAVVFMLASPARAQSTQQCDPNQNTDTRGTNQVCLALNPEYRYCVAGYCRQCSPYLAGDEYICDCGYSYPTVCGKDTSRDSAGRCISPAKYGDACSGAQDCHTPYGDGLGAYQLLCIDRKCRVCDPTGIQSAPFNCTDGILKGQSRACVSPGYWADPSAGVVDGGGDDDGAQSDGAVPSGAGGR